MCSCSLLIVAAAYVTGAVGVWRMDLWEFDYGGWRKLSENERLFWSAIWPVTLLTMIGAPDVRGGE